MSGAESPSRPVTRYVDAFESRFWPLVQLAKQGPDSLMNPAIARFVMALGSDLDGVREMAAHAEEQLAAEIPIDVRRTLASVVVDLEGDFQGLRTLYGQIPKHVRQHEHVRAIYNACFRAYLNGNLLARLAGDDLVDEVRAERAAVRARIDDLAASSPAPDQGARAA